MAKKAKKKNPKCKHCGERHPVSHAIITKEEHDRVEKIERVVARLLQVFDEEKITPKIGTPAMLMILVNSYREDRRGFESLLVAMRNDFERNNSDPE